MPLHPPLMPAPTLLFLLLATSFHAAATAGAGGAKKTAQRKQKATSNTPTNVGKLGCPGFEESGLRGRLEEGIRLKKAGQLHEAEGCIVGALRDAEKRRGDREADEVLTPALCNTGELYKKLGNAERALSTLLICVQRLRLTANVVADDPGNRHTYRNLLEQRALNLFHAGDVLRKLDVRKKLLIASFPKEAMGGSSQASQHPSYSAEIAAVLDQKGFYRKGEVGITTGGVKNASKLASAVLYREAAEQFHAIKALKFSKEAGSNADYGLGVAYHNIGSALTELEPEAAAGAFRNATVFNPKQGASFVNLAQLLGGRDPTEALFLFKTGFELSPEDPEVRDALYAFAAKGFPEPDACRVAWSLLSSLLPKGLPALPAKAGGGLGLGKKAKKKKASPLSDSQVLQGLHCIIHPMGEPRLGVEIAEKISRRAKDSDAHAVGEALYNTATGLMEVRALESESLRIFDIALDTLGCWGRVKSIGETGKASTSSASDAAAVETCAYAMNNKGIVTERAGRVVPEAQELYEGAVALLPNFSRALTNLGGVARYRGDHGEAEKVFLGVLRRDPGFAEAANNLATLYADAGRLDSAAKYYTAAAAGMGSFEPVFNFAHTLKRLASWGSLHSTALHIKRHTPGTATSTSTSIPHDPPRVLHLLSQPLLPHLRPTVPARTALPGAPPGLWRTRSSSERDLPTLLRVPLVSHAVRLRSEALANAASPLIAEASALLLRQQAQRRGAPRPPASPRVALISSDLRQHPVGLALAALLLPRPSGGAPTPHITCYDISDRPDDITDALALGCAGGLRSLQGGGGGGGGGATPRADEALLRLWEGDALGGSGILIDANGNTQGGAERFFAAAFRAAAAVASPSPPIAIIGFVGFPASFGTHCHFSVSDAVLLLPSSVHPRLDARSPSPPPSARDGGGVGGDTVPDSPTATTTTPGISGEFFTEKVICLPSTPLLSAAGIFEVLGGEVAPPVFIDACLDTERGGEGSNPYTIVDHLGEEIRSDPSDEEPEDIHSFAATCAENLGAEQGVAEPHPDEESAEKEGAEEEEGGSGKPSPLGSGWEALPPGSIRGLEEAKAFLLGRRGERKGLPAKNLRLCYTGQHYKVTPRVWGVWMEVLLRGPQDAVLMLSPWEGSARLRMEGLAYGVAAHRLVEMPFFSAEGYRTAHSVLCGAMLDTEGYGGHMSAVDAVSGMVPIVSLAGDSPRSRMSASVMGSVGLADFTTHTTRGYADRLVELLRSPAQLGAARESLRTARSEERGVFASSGYQNAMHGALHIVHRLQQLNLTAHVIPSL